MKKVIVVIGIGFLSVAAILAGTNPSMDNKFVEEGTTLTKKKVETTSSNTLIQPNAFEDYGIDLNLTSNNLIQPDAFEDYDIDLNGSIISSASSYLELIQPDAFLDYGIDLNQKLKPDESTSFTRIRAKEFSNWSSKISNFNIQIFGSRTTPIEVYTKTKGALHFTTYVMETMGQLVTGQDDTQNCTESESSPQFLKLFFNFV